MLIKIGMALAICGAMFFIWKKDKTIAELRRFRLIKDMTEFTSTNMNIHKSIKSVNTLFLKELHAHLSDSTIFLQVDENSLSILDSTIDDETLERKLREIITYAHPDGADFHQAFEEGAIQMIEERGGVSLIYPTAEERNIKSAVLVPLYALGQCSGYWLIEHHDKLMKKLDMKEVAIIGRHLAMVLYSGLNFFNDPLMQIAKRPFVEEYMEDLRCEGRQFCTVFADIDHFKRVNDTYGHEVGDEVLKIIAKVLKMNVRDKDLIGRYGGEEIIICMPDIELEDAVHRLNKIRTQIACLELNIQDKPPLTLTCSFGVVCSTELEHGDTKALIGKADERVYAAKHSGRNQVIYA